ncbi:hypothetical protein Acsp06_52230 [Actinomycetospora sp. NBRC 106375]|uniref:pyridoxamine 5'-phosphate oxidase family protein n=1 Tax=Actinomycetospora sp. NBRC 106375 TaxID=3032207 RepID=UPI0024A1976B|nr:pyridoxamine 5'-phosphate oxidase family protein [Actinomycetospora sp. NBRC 106375]GLZ49038.1 hypothetical protein Acsp06_52230 [Actinomycetospora sp. NBRC 106375]
MDEHDVATELGQPGARDLLETGQLTRLAYTGADGLPRVIPIGFLWTGTAIVVCTVPTSPKARALAKRPEVALVVDAGDTPATARSVSVRGTATLETVDGVAPEYLAAAAKGMSGEEYAGFEEAVRALYRQMVRITIVPRWARYFEFGSGRVPRFLAELGA